MEYYIYINTKGLTVKELHEVASFAKNLKMKDFEEFGDNTIYLTLKENKPFVYKITHTEIEYSSNPFYPWDVNDESNNNIPTYNVMMIEEEIKEN